MWTRRSKGRFEPPLLYARCWEDDATLRQGLRLGPGDDVLSIASAGDNSFALLLDDPRSVTLIDRNTTQLALVHLKIACFRRLSAAATRRFLGISPAPAAERRQAYDTVRPELPAFARATFDAAGRTLEAGILDAGKFERYLATFRDRVLPWVQRRSTVESYAGLTDLEAQRALYRTRWNSWRWRALFRIFFGRRVMERIGRERAFFDHVTQKSIGDVFMERAEKALCALPVATNPYLVWILVARNRVPPYLEDGGFAVIRERLDRLRIVEEDLGGHLQRVEPGTYSAHNLSDCFEYMSQEQTDELLRQIVRVSRPGARLVYWNLLVGRDGAALSNLLDADPERARALHATDRAFFYGRLVLETVRGT